MSLLPVLFLIVVFGAELIFCKFLSRFISTAVKLYFVDKVDFNAEKIVRKTLGV